MGRNIQRNEEKWRKRQKEAFVRVLQLIFNHFDVVWYFCLASNLNIGDHNEIQEVQEGEIQSSANIGNKI